MRAATVSRWAAWLSAAGLVLAVVGFVFSYGPACPGVAGGHCTDATSVWEAVFSVGLLTVVLGAPTAVGVGLYDRLTAPP
jgi:hypothetical protein